LNNKDGLRDSNLNTAVNTVENTAYNSRGNTAVNTVRSLNDFNVQDQIIQDDPKKDLLNTVLNIKSRD